MHDLIEHFVFLRVLQNKKRMATDIFMPIMFSQWSTKVYGVKRFQLFLR